MRGDSFFFHLWTTPIGFFPTNNPHWPKQGAPCHPQPHHLGAPSPFFLFSLSFSLSLLPILTLLSYSSMIISSSTSSSSSSTNSSSHSLHYISPPTPVDFNSTDSLTGIKALFFLEWNHSFPSLSLNKGRTASSVMKRSGCIISRIAVARRQDPLLQEGVKQGFI